MPDITKQKERRWKARREKTGISCCAGVHSSTVLVIRRKKNSKGGQKYHI